MDDEQHGYIVHDHNGEEYARAYSQNMNEAIIEAGRYLVQLEEGGTLRRVRPSDALPPEEKQ